MVTSPAHSCHGNSASRLGSLLTKLNWTGLYCTVQQWGGQEKKNSVCLLSCSCFCLLPFWAYSLCRCCPKASNSQLQLREKTSALQFCFLMPRCPLLVGQRNDFGFRTAAVAHTVIQTRLALQTIRQRNWNNLHGGDVCSTFVKEKWWMRPVGVTWQCGHVLTLQRVWNATFWLSCKAKWHSLPRQADQAIKMDLLLLCRCAGKIFCFLTVTLICQHTKGELPPFNSSRGFKRRSNLTHSIHCGFLWVHSDIDNPHLLLESWMYSTNHRLHLSGSHAVSELKCDSWRATRGVELAGRWATALAAVYVFINLHPQVGPCISREQWHFWREIISSTIFCSTPCVKQAQDFFSKSSGWQSHVNCLKHHRINWHSLPGTSQRLSWLCFGEHGQLKKREPSFDKVDIILLIRCASQLMDYLYPHRVRWRNRLKLPAPQKTEIWLFDRQSKDSPQPHSRKKVQSSDQLLPGGWSAHSKRAMPSLLCLHRLDPCCLNTVLTVGLGHSRASKESGVKWYQEMTCHYSSF